MSRSRSRLRRHPLALATHLLLAGLAVPGLAQQADSEATKPASAKELDTVTVTATRRAATVQDVPLNLTATTGLDIEQQNLTDLADLVKTVPGLFLVDQGGRDANLLTVRGLNTNSLSSSEGVGSDGGGVVAQYLGDIPLYLDLRLTDIERVETLLGPQGTLYGAGTLGGAIRYLPVRPQLGETSVQATTGLSSSSHSGDTGMEISSILNLPIGQHGALRASFGKYHDPGWVDYDFLVREPGVSNPQPDFSDPEDVAANLYRKRDANDLTTSTARVGLRWMFGDAVDANLTYYYQRQESGGRTTNQMDSFGTGQYVSAYRFLEPNDRKSQLLALEVSADLGFATLTSASGYSEYDELGQRDQTDLLLGFEYGYEDFPSFAAYTREEQDTRRFTQELRLVSNSSGPFTWIVGGFYDRSDLTAYSSEFVPGIPEFWGIDRPDNLEYFQATFDKPEEKAIFGEVGYDFTEKWNVTVGGRWFKYDDAQKVGFALPLVDGSAPDEVAITYDPVNVSDKDSIFKFNTSYKLTDDVLLYATVSEGYRSGGANAVPACLDPLPAGQNVCALPNERLIQPDKTTNHELGVRSSWLDNRLVLNGALYSIDWDDVQVAGTTVNGAIPITVNGAKAKSQGVELSAQARLLPDLRLTASYTYNNAELTEDAPGIVSGDDAFDGDRLPGSPEHMGNVSLQYTHSLAGGLIFDANYSVAAQSDVYSRVGLRNGGEVLPGFAVHNTSVSLSGSAWKFTLYAKNLFDRYAETAVRNTPASIANIEGDGTSFALRNYSKAMIAPLRVGASFTYYFQ
ncbi:Outer membrane receptor proteins, mostly Fe transport [Pseudoxanthomonas sp. GM95]|uniref:TonB-dependent receptor n=1 Tax=Pseudoxanthomonas sp. GM95 TaxID=1881043 RepID=UPI0008B8E014|nr:TonB-dependent receptor [Pseudoxanthomonas sp. GM95]SEL44269.1 Outer membrane receptor proteins, mostly Fe transport [Pseudoxanthomonas sp. GM95]